MNKRAITSRERIRAAMTRQPVDHEPLSVSFNELTPVQRQGHTWQFPWQADTPPDQKLRYQVEELGLDQVVDVPVDVCRATPEVESRVWLEGEVLHKSYRTSQGELHAAVRYNELWPHGQDIPFYSDFNIGHYLEPWIQSEADLACFQEIQQFCSSVEVADGVRASCAASVALAQRFALATAARIGMGLTGAQQLFGASELCLLTIDQPGLVDAYLEYEHQINLCTICLLAQTGVDIIWRNGFYETADFYSPAMLEQFLAARLSAEADAVHEAGMLMNYTVHTGVMPILDYLAALPMDSLFGIDIAFKGVDPVQVRDKLASSKSLWVGPSSTYHLWQGADATRRAVRDVFEVFGRMGVILSPGVSSHSIMPWESTLAMIDEWQNGRFK